MTRSEALLPVSMLAELFELRATGELLWKARPAGHFASESSAKSWNSKHAGRPALIATERDGRAYGRINGMRFYAYRVIWAIATGSWPQYEIDHINGNPQDNRLENLRDVPHAHNQRNQAIRRDNTTGVPGVEAVRGGSKWRAYIRVDGRHKHLGQFDSKEQAADARRAALNEYRFHPNHGRKAA